jgi:hypothetical protein
MIGIFIVLCGIGVGVLGLGLYCTLIISGRCADEESFWEPLEDSQLSPWVSSSGSGLSN